MRTRTLRALGSSLIALVAVGAALVPSASPATAAPAVVGAAAAPAVTDVLAIRTNPDGTTTYTSYRTPVGVTAAQLYHGLKAEGVVGLQDPSASSITTMDVFQCYYGTAYALNGGQCPAAQWKTSGRARPLVHFNDHSSSAWPVMAAGAKWNESCCVDVTVGFGYCSSATGQHCVHVWSDTYGRTNSDGTPKWVGLTTWSLDSQRYFVENSMSVQLNDSYNDYSAAQHRNTACHELGHAIGVGHNASKSSCVYPSVTSQQYPSSDDFYLLSNIIY